MMTITYEYEGALYVNLTNRCNCNCAFCLRHGQAEGSIYTENSLWLDHEPSLEEAMDSFLSRDIPAVYLIREDGRRICVRDTFETAQLNTPKR